MTLLINGTPHDFKDSTGIPDLLAHLGLEPRTVLVEHNGIALHRQEWTTTLLSEGDRIEILQVAAGG
jgi:sulfur carrier protein